MKEKGILFTAPMVRAYLAGLKSQTRRLVKPELVEAFDFMSGRSDGEPGTSEDIDLRWAISLDDEGKQVAAQWLLFSADNPEEGCIPIGRGYGNVGDRLWIRETFMWPGEEELIYRADPGAEERVARCRNYPNFPPLKWTPSIFMPRVASRITLDITEIRVERLHEISEHDAIAEGAHDFFGKATPWGNVCAPMAVHGYASLWEHINGPGSWAKNPWVWVISFPAHVDQQLENKK